MGKTLLLTGDPRVGKTTIVKKVIKNLGDSAGGFYTQEIFGPGGRKGFEIITLDGKKEVLAHKNFCGLEVPHIGRYGVDLDILDTVAVTAIKEAIKSGKIVVIDGIGKMELLSKDFQHAVMQAIMGRSVVFGTIIKKPYLEADVFKGLAQVTVWEIEKRTRKAMQQRAIEWLERQTYGCYSA